MAIHLGELGVEFEREYLYAKPRKLRADFLVKDGAFGSVLRHPIIIEVQGGVFSRQAHGSISGVLADNERLNLATKHGFHMLRFTPDQVMSGEAKRIVAEVLGIE